VLRHGYDSRINYIVSISCSSRLYCCATAVTAGGTLAKHHN
jgi:hypothetical protein